MKQEKMVSIIVPCYNESSNVKRMGEALVSILEKTKYKFEILFVDNASIDDTKKYIYEVTSADKRIKALINNRNYGVGGRKGRECYENVKGDAIIVMACDFQDPIEMLPEFFEWWEKGYKVVCGQKIGSKEGRLKYGLRQLFYKIINSFSDIPQYANISGIKLIDREVMDEYLKIDLDYDFNYALADMGYEVKLLQYEQQKRRSGKSSYNISRYLTYSINSLVTTSVKPIRLITVTGGIFTVSTVLVAVVCLICKIVWWNSFNTVIIPIVLAIAFFCSIQLLSIGIIGEYLCAVLRKVTRQPDLIIKERINFEDES